MIDHVQAAHTALEHRKAAAAGVEYGARGWHNMRDTPGVLAGTDLTPSEWEAVNDAQARRMIPLLMNVGPLHGLAGAHGEGFLLGHQTAIEQRKADRVDDRLRTATGALRRIATLEAPEDSTADNPLDELLETLKGIAATVLEELER